MADTSLARALTILEASSNSADGETFTALREKCGDVASTTVTRIVKPLCDMGYLLKDPASGRYRAGPALKRLAVASLAQRRPEDVAPPVLADLSAATHESAAFFTWDGAWISLEAKRERPDAYHFADLHTRFYHKADHPYFRAIQAHLPAKTLSRVFATGKSRGGRVVDRNAKLLAGVRRDGYVTLDASFRGASRHTAAPVFDGPDGRVVGAVGVSYFPVEYTKERLDRLTRLVVEAAEQFTTRMGG